MNKIETVTAYRDSRGNLHKDAEHAIRAELRIIANPSGPEGEPISDDHAGNLFRSRAAVIALLQSFEG
jgi:hypothetical protein